MSSARVHEPSLAATTIIEPPAAHVNTPRGGVRRFDLVKSDADSASFAIASDVDLEKGVHPETRGSRRSSTISNATTRSSNSDWEDLKTPDAPPSRLTLLKSRARRFLDHHFTTYRKVFTLIFIVNIAILIALVSTSSSSPLPTSAANAAAVNLAVGVLFRQEQVVNALFRILTSVPLSWPLWIRGSVAKVFHYGGMHSGCGVAAVAWFLLYTALATKAYVEAPDNGTGEAVATAWILVALFGLLLGGAYPAFRVRYHNLFEAFHRFAGWAALAVFWAHVLFSAHAAGQLTDTPMSAVLVRSVPFWCIFSASIPIVASWAQLRRRTVHVEPLSDHATRLRFDYAEMQPCFGIRVSTNPLLEWHSFATIPNTLEDIVHQPCTPSPSTNFSLLFPPRSAPPASAHPSSSNLADSEGDAQQQPGFSLIVSNAGDWTQRTIKSPPRTLWTRGSPVRGVIYAARLFSRVVIVATGSGIGPCLSLLVAHRHLLPMPPRVLWSAPHPEATFGRRLVSAVRCADPHAIIWDTRAQGRPDLCAMAYEMAKQAGAEAVFVISNPRVCKAVTTGLQDRGVRAYAPIFDS